MQDKALQNIKPPCYLDATEKDWAASIDHHDFILLINFLHLISWNETQTLVNELANTNPRNH